MKNEKYAASMPRNLVCIQMLAVTHFFFENSPQQKNEINYRKMYLVCFILVSLQYLEATVALEFTEAIYFIFRLLFPVKSLGNE